MEIFPIIICAPFLLARKKLILDKADANLMAQYRSNEAHSLANAIEEKVDTGVDTNSDNNNNNKHHQNNIQSNLTNPNNKGNWKRKQKTSMGRPILLLRQIHQAPKRKIIKKGSRNRRKQIV